jgi:hypothetical protein
VTLQRRAFCKLTAKAACVRAEPRARPSPEAALARFEIGKDRVMLLLPVELTGKIYIFLLDTGQ